MAPVFIYNPLCATTPTCISTTDISDITTINTGIGFITFRVCFGVPYNYEKKKETRKEMLDRTSKEKMLASRFMFNEKIIERKNRVSVIKHIKPENFIKRKLG